MLICMATRDTTTAKTAATKAAVNQASATKTPAAPSRRAPATRKAASTEVARPLQAHPQPIVKGDAADQLFDLAAEMFRVMSAPMRLKIINCLCDSEKNVGQLLDEINTTQPNMSQHLNTLFKAKILGRRREGVQIYYRVVNERLVSLCRAMCAQIAIDSKLPH